MTLLFRPSYDNAHRCYRVVRVRDGVDEYTLSTRYPTAQAALRAVDRLDAYHGISSAPVVSQDDDEGYWRQVALGGEWDDEEAGI